MLVSVNSSAYNQGPDAIHRAFNEIGDLTLVFIAINITAAVFCFFTSRLPPLALALANACYFSYHWTLGNVHEGLANTTFNLRQEVTRLNQAINALQHENTVHRNNNLMQERSIEKLNTTARDFEQISTTLKSSVDAIKRLEQQLTGSNSTLTIAY